MASCSVQDKSYRTVSLFAMLSRSDVPPLSARTTAVTAICDAAALHHQHLRNQLDCWQRRILVIHSDFLFRFLTLPGFEVVVVFKIHMRDAASLMYADRSAVVLHHLSGGLPAFCLNSDLNRKAICVDVRSTFLISSFVRCVSLEFWEGI